MAKKELVLLVLLVLVIIPFTYAAEQTDVDKAYDCLKAQVNETTCSKMSLEEKIFTSLSIGECTDYIINNSENGECWKQSSSNCQLDITSKAILSLDKAGQNINNYTDWLFSQNKTTTDLDWFLQITAFKDNSRCELYYNENIHSLSFNKDKVSPINLGNCLSVSDNGYWLEISPDCYGKEFEVSCNSSFSTNLLFREQGGTTFNILGKTSSASPGGTTSEQVNSLCFQERGMCSYKGTLWAVTILNYRGKDVSEYMPYLIALKDNYKQYLPSGFLYSSTGNSRYSNELMSRRIPVGYWEESGNRYYDTALAMNFLYNSGVTGLSKTKEWITKSQDEDGCWNNGNIMDTAFILYSVWPRDISPGDEVTDCFDVGGECISSSNCSDSGGTEISEYSDTCPGNDICCDTPSNDSGVTCFDVGGECISSSNCSDSGGTELYEYSDTCPENDVCCDTTEDSDMNCTEAEGHCLFYTSCTDVGGEELYGYSDTCPGTKICCDQSKEEKTCEELAGNQEYGICDSDEWCTGEEKYSASDISGVEICCIGGTCNKTSSPAPGNNETPIEEDCVQNGGTCRFLDCGEGEEESTYYTCAGSDVCCMSKEEEEGSLWWLWILIILIILVVLGIIFKDKLKEWWLKIKSGSGNKRKPGPRGPGGRRPPGHPPSRQVPRRIMPKRAPPQQKRKKTNSKEMDDVLGKLKEMSK